MSTNYLPFHSDGTGCEVAIATHDCPMNHEWRRADEQWELGRYATYADAYADWLVQDGEYDGDMEAPSGWFAAADLPDDHPLALHYGSQHILVVAGDQGFVNVTAHTLEMRDHYYDILAESYAEWVADDRI